MKLSGRPLHERVIVKLDNVGEVTQGGIILPEEARDIANTATVISIGNLVNTEGESLQVGDRVIIQKMGGMPLDIKGVRYQLMMKHDILYVFGEDEV
jgi:co-chaperonin GroES (HSP10)